MHGKKTPSERKSRSVPIFSLVFVAGIASLLAPCTLDRSPTPSVDGVDPPFLPPGGKVTLEIPTTQESLRAHHRIMSSQSLFRLSVPGEPGEQPAPTLDPSTPQGKDWGTLRKSRLYESIFVSNVITARCTLLVPDAQALRGKSATLSADVAMDFPSVPGFGEFRYTVNTARATRTFELHVPTREEQTRYETWLDRKSKLRWLGIAAIVLSIVGGMWRVSKE